MQPAGAPNRRDCWRVFACPQHKNGLTAGSTLARQWLRHVAQSSRHRVTTHAARIEQRGDIFYRMPFISICCSRFAVQYPVKSDARVVPTADRCQTHNANRAIHHEPFAPTTRKCIFNPRQIFFLDNDLALIQTCSFYQVGCVTAGCIGSLPQSVFKGVNTINTLLILCPSALKLCFCNTCFVGRAWWTANRPMS